MNFNSLLHRLHLLKKPPTNIIGLHLGGWYKIPGFWNVDASSKQNPDILTTVDGLRFAPGSFQYIYASHVLEHIPRWKVRGVLHRWFTLLKPGGLLYIGVPDLEVLANNLLSLSEEKYNTNDYELCVGMIYGGQTDQWNYHYFGYTFEHIRHLLREAGFSQVTRFEEKDLPFPQPEDAAKTASYKNQRISLNIRADVPS